ncbi:MAG TPA: hypothetical protein VGC74_18280 [Stenotrophomonas sp.]
MMDSFFLAALLGALATPVVAQADLPATAPATVAAAISRAQADETSLAAEPHAALVKTQREALDDAFASCVPAPVPDTIPAFTVVLELDASGMPRRSWLQGDDATSRCMEKALSRYRLAAPPRTPFYVFFELSFKP